MGTDNLFSSPTDACYAALLLAQPWVVLRSAPFKGWRSTDLIVRWNLGVGKKWNCDKRIFQGSNWAKLKCSLPCHFCLANCAQMRQWEELSEAGGRGLLSDASSDWLHFRALTHGSGGWCHQHQDHHHHHCCDLWFSIFWHKMVVLPSTSLPTVVISYCIYWITK